MADQPPDNRMQPLPPSEPEDPRLRIPDVLQQPLDVSTIRRTKPPSALAGVGDLGKALAIGLDFLFTAAAAAALGWLLDRWLGWAPYGMITGLAIGFIAGTFRMLKRLNAPDRSAPKSRSR